MNKMLLCNVRPNATCGFNISLKKKTHRMEQNRSTYRMTGNQRNNSMNHLVNITNTARFRINFPRYIAVQTI